MTILEAKGIINDLAYRSHLEPDEEFLLIEAYEYLIEQTKAVRWMSELGGYYYEQKEFDLACKYYEMADACGDKWAPEGLGYIWYYGRTGEVDYEKAFKYYKRASENGYVRSTIKVADMYKNGYYVDKDYNAYCNMIETAYDQLRDETLLYQPVPEVCMRLARIRTAKSSRPDVTAEEKMEAIQEAISLYEEAKAFLAERLSMNVFFGDLNQMEWLVEDLAELRPRLETERRKAGSDDGKDGESGDAADAAGSGEDATGSGGDAVRPGEDATGFGGDAGRSSALDLYDLFVLLQEPGKVQFVYRGESYEVEAVREEDGSIAVRFLDKWYRSVNEFLYEAILDDEKLPILYYGITDIKR